MKILIVELKKNRDSRRTLILTNQKLKSWRYEIVCFNILGRI